MNNLHKLCDDMETSAWENHVPNTVAQNQKIIGVYDAMQTPNVIAHISDVYGQFVYDAIDQTISFLCADGYMIQNSRANVYELARGFFTHITGENPDGDILFMAVDYVWNNL